MYGALEAEYMSNLTDKKAKALGIAAQTIGKTQARKEFFPLVDSLNSANSAVEITDHDEPVAVLMSYQNYVALTAKASANLAPSKPQKPNLLGSIVINSDLEVASARLAARFKSAIDESAENL
ncbi:MAG: type II toxin-antitoxin system prevent-host-death family antitoxin [Cyanobacteria bacterium REEB67]|nr:type II toxin-antitoxin system prevent-host-death family antitoxin [Cyanobacteria bacterium REEB67]